MSKRTLNVKFLSVDVGLGILLGGGAYVAYRVQLGRTLKALLVEADRAEATGDYGRAERALERYLAIRPHELVILARYGLVLDHQGTNPRARLQAFLALGQVLRHDPGRRDVRRRLVDVAMGLGRFAEARTHLEILQKSSPRDGHLDDLRGRCDEAHGTYKTAASWYERAIADTPPGT